MNGTQSIAKPFVHINFAVTAEGAMTDGAGALSCEKDWVRVHELREEYDATAVGASTWRLDQPQLNVREERLGREPRRQPLRVIFAGSQQCAIGSRDARTIVIGSSPEPYDGTTYFPSYGHELERPLRSLWHHGVRSILLEGGPTLIRSFLRQGAADVVTAYIRCRCTHSAMRAARAVMPELPAEMAAMRFGDGVLLRCAPAPIESVAPLKSQAVRFVIIAAPRTGSNMLCTMLNAHPEILCHHELFNPGGIHFALDHRNGELDLGSLAERDRRPDLFLGRMFDHRCGRNAVGFKLNLGQSEAAFQHVLLDRSVRKIVLRRRNRVKAFVSEMIAEQTGQWESYEFSDYSIPNPVINVSAARLHQQLEKTDHYYSGINAILRATGQTKLEVNYEDLGRADEQQRILSFLNVSATGSTLSPSTRKRNSSHLRMVVSNFEELRSSLTDPELQAQLESPDL